LRKNWNDNPNSKSSTFSSFEYRRRLTRKSEAERKRYYEIARGSVIEIDAALDIAVDLAYLRGLKTESLGESMISCFKMLTGLIESNKVK
jgi:four helix bundle protein